MSDMPIHLDRTARVSANDDGDVVVTNNGSIYVIPLALAREIGKYADMEVQGAEYDASKSINLPCTECEGTGKGNLLPCPKCFGTGILAVVFP